MIFWPLFVLQIVQVHKCLVSNVLTVNILLFVIHSYTYTIEKFKAAFCTSIGYGLWLYKYTTLYM